MEDCPTSPSFLLPLTRRSLGAGSPLLWAGLLAGVLTGRASEPEDGSGHADAAPPTVHLSEPAVSVPVDPISAGMPAFAHFPPDLLGGAQHFDGIAQTRDRRIYVVADHRLLVGTGERWQPVPGLPERKVRQMHLATDGRLYLSLEGDFGYIYPKAKGGVQWQSIAELLPAEGSDRHPWKPLFEDARGFVYIAGSGHVLAHHPTKPMRLWRDLGEVAQLFQWHGEVHLITAGREMYRLENSGKAEPMWRDIPPDYAIIHAHLQLGKDRPLFASNGGLFTLDKSGFQLFELVGMERERVVPEKLLALGDGLFLALDDRHGLIVFRADGTVLRQFLQIGDLRAPVAQAVTIDHDGWIWLAHSAGLFRLDPRSPYTNFDYRQGLGGRVMCMTEHDGSFYVGTESGLFLWTETETGEPGYFARVPNVPAVHSMVPTDQGLAVGTLRGLWVIEGRGPYRVESNRLPLILQSPSAPESLLAPTAAGIRTFSHNGVRWVPATGAQPWATSGEAVTLGSDGSLWGEYGPGRLAHITFDATTHRPHIFGPKQGLPFTALEPLRLGDEMLFQGGEDILLFVSERGIFRRSEDWAPVAPEVGHIPTERTLKGPDESLWAATAALKNHYIAFPPQNFAHAWPDMLRFGVDPITAIYTDSAGTLWIGNRRGLQRYRPGASEASSALPGQTLVYRITTDDPAHPLTESHTGEAALDLGILSQPHRLLRFEYSMLDFNAPGGVTYATFLEGFDEAWQPYSPESALAFTALPPGTYTLYIKGRNRNGEVGAPATIAFAIPLSPFETWWARTLYVFSGIGALSLLVYLKQRQSMAAARNLRQNLAERDVRIEEQEAELKTRASQLKSAVNRADELSEHADQLIQNRVRFEVELDRTLRPAVANLRELGQALGPAPAAEETRHILHECRQAGDQLVSAMREQLDLRKIEIDHLPVEERAFHLRDPLAKALFAVSNSARAKGIELNYTLDSGMALARAGDPARLEHILTALLANAVAHSADSEVTVAVRPPDPETPEEIEFAVIDRGAGFDDEAQQSILAQSDPRNPSRYSAGPQGLAIVRHLLEALGGDLELKSTPGEGTEAKFQLSLPAEPDSHAPAPEECRDKCVLIVEGHPTTRQSLQLLAEQSGLRTRLAEDAPAALAATAEAPLVDLLWIAENFAETPGHALLEQIRKTAADPTMPAVLLASAPHSPALLALTEDPLTLVVQKPAHHAALLAATVALLPAVAEAATSANADDDVKDTDESDVSAKDSAEAEAEDTPEAPTPAAARTVAWNDEENSEPEDPMDAKIRQALAKSNMSPAAYDEEGNPLSDEPARARSPLSILLVDAHSARSQSTRTLMRQLGYEAEIAADLSAATAALEAQDRDLVLLADPLPVDSLVAATTLLKKAVPGETPPLFVALTPEKDEIIPHGTLDAHLRTPLNPIALERLLQRIQPAETAAAVTA